MRSLTANNFPSVVSNRPKTYYYLDNEEACLTPNHLLYGRQLNSKLLSDTTTQLNSKFNRSLLEKMEKEVCCKLTRTSENSTAEPK